MAPQRQPEPGSPEFSERLALQEALCEVVARRGFRASTPDSVARAAGVPAERFFLLYADTEECYLALYDRAVSEVRTAMTEGAKAATWAYGEDQWRHHLDGSVGALLSYLSGRERMTETLIGHVASAGPAALARREAMLAEFVMDLEAARGAHGSPVPPLASEVLVRGIYQVIFARVQAGDTRHLRLLLEDLSYFWHPPDLGR